MDVVVLADTHLRSGLDGLGAGVIEAIEGADLVLHAGDVVSQQALNELRGVVELRAVLGNNDHELRGLVPETLTLELGGVQVAMVHDSGPTRGRAGRLARRFPDARIVIFGHSHIPIDEAGIDGQLLFNPGSPTQRRAQPHRTFGRLQLEGGEIRSRSIEALG